MALFIFSYNGQELPILESSFSIFTGCLGKITTIPYSFQGYFFIMNTIDPFQNIFKESLKGPNHEKNICFYRAAYHAAHHLQARLLFSHFTSFTYSRQRHRHDSVIQFITDEGYKS